MVLVLELARCLMLDSTRGYRWSTPFWWYIYYLALTLLIKSVA
jgi:hypothetical protein